MKEIDNKLTQKFDEYPSFGVLKGVKVFVTGTNIAGPFAGCLMAEMGAKVLQAEAPTIACQTRGTLAWSQNHRNEYSITINSASPAGKKIFLKCIEWADIWIEAGRPGSYAKRGLTDEVCWKHNKKLAIVHVSGYGQFGPSKNKPSYDVSGQAMGGYMYMNGVSPTSGPLKVNPYLSDYITAYNACMVALAGYINAKNSGEGDSCDVAQYDTMFRLLDNYPANWFNKGYPKQGEPVPFRTGNKSDQAACFSFYDTKEGNAMFVAIVGQGPVTRGYPIIGMGKPGVTEGIPKNCTGFPLFDPRGKKADELCAKFCAEHTCDEIEEIFNKAGIPCQRAYGPADIEKDPQYEARENIVEWDDQCFGKMKGIGVTNIFKKNPSQIVASAPCFGEHNREVLKDFGYTDEATFEGKPEHVVLYHFKPDFMLDNLRSNNYICHLTVFSRALMERAGGGERMEYNGSQDYELFLRLTEQAEKIVHIPHALYYWRSSPGSTAADISAKTYCIDAGIAALKAHYARCGIAVDDVALIPGTPGYYKTDYTIEHPGRVSILIPTCDHIRDLELCVDSIYARTTYPDFELILIENNSKQPETFRAYERMQKEHPDNLKVVTWEGKGFNYSALNNFGEQYATGEYLLLLNNDTEVITPNWLEEMVMYAQQKRVGCVGAKLLYPDDTIQHAGIGFGIGGVAGHLHKYFPAASDGYMGRLNYVQDVYGDTAACLLIRREIYDEMNGLDESYAVAFNDVDFCVRVREAGYTNVFTPFAQLYHYESKSRGTEDNPEKQKRFQGEVLRFQARWGDLLAAGDPCTNPNFDIQREDFTLKILPLE